MITHLEPDILECEVTWALEIITTNKASGGDGISAELFQILKDNVALVLHSVCQQTWKTQQWPQDWKRSIFVTIPKQGNGKECSDYRTMALISHTSKVLVCKIKYCTIVLISYASKVTLKILQARLQQYLNQELSAGQAGFGKGR